MKPADKIRNFDKDNLEAAHIIFSYPERYPGLPTEWAILFMKRFYEKTLQR